MLPFCKYGQRLILVGFYFMLLSFHDFCLCACREETLDFEGHEILRFTREQLLQLKDVTSFFSIA